MERKKHWIWGGNGGDLAGSDHFGFAHVLFSPVFGMLEKSELKGHYKWVDWTPMFHPYPTEFLWK